MYLSELMSKLLEESDFTQKSLEEVENLGEKFLTNNLNAKSGTMKKLDRAFDALTPNVTVADLMITLDFLIRIKNDTHNNFL